MASQDSLRSEIAVPADRRARRWGGVVVVERRRRDRRRPERRVLDRGELVGGRRTILNADGRRIADRRDDNFIAAQPPDAETRLNVDSLRLVVRFQGGDTDALAELHALWAADLLAYFRGGLHDHHAAEDAVQELAAALLQDKLRRYVIVPEVPFRPWLFRIAQRKRVDELRRRARLSVEDPHEIAARRERERWDPDVAERIERWALDGTLRRLPRRQREVVALRYIYNLTGPEIAQALAITTGTVRQNELRAMQTLRRFAGPTNPRWALRASMRRLDPQPPVIHARKTALRAA
jgi:RNA polymerase sigma-70 factor, ECF subfamily